VWLTFHERYAGYSENLGGDVARWGLAFESASWLARRQVAFIRFDGEITSIACADVHPSHDYLLFTEGEFVGPLSVSSSFEIKVERDALSTTRSARTACG
jgi:hypothetical protein